MWRALRAAIPASLLCAVACTSRGPAPDPTALTAPNGETMSGFLDDYSLLRPGGPDELRLVYRNPRAEWTRYDKILLDPVTVWRSGKGSLDPVPEADLLRLAADFERAVRRSLGGSFTLVDAAGPGVMRIRFAITDARANDPVLDVLTARPDAGRRHPGGALHPETRRFVAAAMIEGEIRDAQSGALLAQGVDYRPNRSSLEGASTTWIELNQRMVFWVDRLSARLERVHDGEQPGRGTNLPLPPG
jgi:hypothetical protein